jgi:hypothetical protein
MTAFLACIDGYNYGPSVCDHAVWLSRATDAQIQVLHVIGGAPRPRAFGRRPGSYARNRCADGTGSTCFVC